MNATELVYRLLTAAGRVCDLYDDGEQARVDMRADVLSTPAHLQADLLEHFTSITRATAEISAAADFDEPDDDSGFPPSFGASTGFDPFTGPPGGVGRTGNSDPASPLFTKPPRGVKLSPQLTQVFDQAADQTHDTALLTSTDQTT